MVDMDGRPSSDLSCFEECNEVDIPSWNEDDEIMSDRELMEFRIMETRMEPLRWMEPLPRLEPLRPPMEADPPPFNKEESGPSTMKKAELRLASNVGRRVAGSWSAPSTSLSGDVSGAGSSGTALRHR